ncbi:hypothetical protein ACTFIZ_010323 [Dictyostelium cf. discoideum]
MIRLFSKSTLFSGINSTKSISSVRYISNNSATSESPKILEYKRTRDQVINAHNEKFRFSIINLTKAANISKTKHNLSISDAQLLGKLMSGVSMCASFLSDEERISAQIISDINPTHIYAEAIHVGEVRGFLINGDTPRLETPDQVINRKGIFQFSKILYGHLKPIQSVVAVEEKDLTITKEFQHYFDQSEQIPSFIQLETKLKSNYNNNDNNNNNNNNNIVINDEIQQIEDKQKQEQEQEIINSNNDIIDNDQLQFNGGILIQTLPSTTEEELVQLKTNIEKYSIADLFLKEKKSIKEILSILTNNDPSVEVISTIFVDFYCRCTLKTFKDKILTLGINEIKHLEEHNHNELKCIYCNRYHYLKDTDFKEMINHLEQDKEQKLKVLKEMEQEEVQEQQQQNNNNNNNNNNNEKINDETKKE